MTNRSGGGFDLLGQFFKDVPRAKVISSMITAHWEDDYLDTMRVKRSIKDLHKEYAALYTAWKLKNGIK